MRNRVFYQYYATLVVNLLIFIEGLSISWSAPYVPLLMTHETPLESGPMTENEVSWIVALSSCGGVISTIICGLLLETIGRKYTLILAGIPCSIGWLCILLAKEGFLLGFGRILTGCAGSLAFMSVPVFVSEITDDQHRGQLGSVMSLSCNFGILSGFILTTYTNYYMMPILIEVLFLIYFSLVFVVAESPRYLRSKNQHDKAEKALNYYINPKPQDLELKKSGEDEKLQSLEPSQLQLSDFKRPEYWKPILIALIGAPFTICSGTHTIICFTKQIFDETGSHMSSERSMIIIALVQLVGSYTAVSVIEKAGRKTLLFFSTFGCGLCLLGNGTYYYLKALGYNTHSYSFLPLICVSLLFFIFAVGVASVPYVIITEILPQKVKGLIFTICQLETLFVLIVSARVSTQS